MHIQVAEMTEKSVDSQIINNGFACDAMLKGLTRWLRAGGYDTRWTYGIKDEDLIRVANEECRVLMTSDSGIMETELIKTGEVAALFLPRDLSVAAQVEFVFTHFNLKQRAPRCMKCGGSLAWVPKASVRNEAPPKTYCWLDDFYRCLRCGQLFWKGTHWENICERLNSYMPK